MNRNPQRLKFDPSSPQLRKIFVIAAVAATVATFAFIDALARSYALPAVLVVQSPLTAIAQR